MIYCLTGKLLEKAPDYAVVSCGGVGYLAAIPSTTAGALPAVGDTCTLYTCMNVTENDVSLFGFADKESQTMFRLLTGVSGVGPKVGLAILSVLSPDRVVLAISAGDHKAFTAASGVGPKLGQRIVLELKDKVGKGLATGLAWPMLPVRQRLQPRAAWRRPLPPSQAWAIRAARPRRPLPGWIRLCLYRNLSALLCRASGKEGNPWLWKP